MKDGFVGSRAIIMPKSVIEEMEQDWFCSKLYITDIGYYPIAARHKRKRDSGISQHILIYCVNGEGWFELGNKRYDISSNQCFILPPDVPHSYGTSHNPWTIYWIHFKGDFASHYVSGVNSPFSLTNSDTVKIYNHSLIFEDIIQALEKGYGKDNLEFSCSALHHYLGAIKYLSSSSDLSERKSRGQHVVDSAITYMKNNIERSVTLRELGAHFGYSESYFLSLFKKRTGYSPINYMIQLKIQLACHLLDFTDMRINQICHKVGISDPYYFSKLFTRVMGCTPSIYKATKKG